MAELICRTLRDGGLEGEQAPALSINDEIDCSLGFCVFEHILLQLCSFVSSQKSSARGIVLVALSRSPLYYEKLMKKNGIDVSGSSKWLKVLDCFTDPLCWKSKLGESGTVKNLPLATSLAVTSCKSIKDKDALLSSILELGKEMSLYGKGGSLLEWTLSMRCIGMHPSFLFRHLLILFVVMAISALEYASTMKATVEPIVTLADGPIVQSSNITLMEQNLRRGKLFARIKRRNGRVKSMFEEFCATNSGVKFSPVSSEDVITAQSLVPAVQFNLQLSEKERFEREKVILPFEHQGNGAEVQIYDGRKPELQQCNCNEKGSGEIIYFRDSDDEMPDSDEDPDDDLDI